MTNSNPNLGGSLNYLWDLGRSLGGIHRFSPAYEFDPQAIDAVIGAGRTLPNQTEYLNGMSIITNAVVLLAPRGEKIQLMGRPWEHEYHPPTLSVSLKQGELGNVLDLEVRATPEFPRNQEGMPVTLARVPMALLVAEAEGTLGPEMCLEAKFPELQRLTAAFGAVMLEGIIDFHGPAGQSPHE
jgi:hypothetical protein